MAVRSPLREGAKRPRVLLADDHQAVLEYIPKLLEPQFEVVGTVNDGRSLLAAAEKFQPDVMIVDISMPVLNGLEAVRRLNKKDPKQKVVFLTIHEDRALVDKALASGALSYVLKTRAHTDLIEAIQEALEGRCYVSPPLRADEGLDRTESRKNRE